MSKSMNLFSIQTIKPIFRAFRENVFSIFFILHTHIRMYIYSLSFCESIELCQFSYSITSVRSGKFQSKLKDTNTNRLSTTLLDVNSIHCMPIFIIPLLFFYSVCVKYVEKLHILATVVLCEALF